MRPVAPSCFTESNGPVPRGGGIAGRNGQMETTSGIIFGPYRLDVGGGRLWQGTDPVSLQPRPLAVLAYLAARPGAVVARDELIEQVWEGTHVTKAVLKVAVRAIREALDDDADTPRYIETVGREGYRFIGGAAAAHPTAARAETPDGQGVMVARASAASSLVRSSTRPTITP